MDLLVLFSTAFIVGLSGALMPGPVTAVVVEHSLKRGVIAAPLVTLGHGIMEVLAVVLLAFGLGRFVEAPVISGMIGIAGGIVLSFMGWNMIKSARNVSLHQNEGGASVARDVHPVLAGMLSTLANPYWFLWWLTVGASYVALSQRHGPTGVFLFFSGHIMADLSWLVVIALLFAAGKKWINDRIYGGIIRVLGIFLLVFAGYFLWTGITWISGV